jgi:hypothetical protein
MSSNIFHIEEETRLKTYELFEKTELTVNEDAVIIKEWLETQPHLPEILGESFCVALSDKHCSTIISLVKCYK